MLIGGRVGGFFICSGFTNDQVIGVCLYLDTFRKGFTQHPIYDKILQERGKDASLWTTLLDLCFILAVKHLQ